MKTAALRQKFARLFRNPQPHTRTSRRAGLLFPFHRPPPSRAAPCPCCRQFLSRPAALTPRGSLSRSTPCGCKPEPALGTRTEAWAGLGWLQPDSKSMCSHAMRDAVCADGASGPLCFGAHHLHLGPIEADGHRLATLQPRAGAHSVPAETLAELHALTGDPRQSLDQSLPPAARSVGGMDGHDRRRRGRTPAVRRACSGPVGGLRPAGPGAAGPPDVRRTPDRLLGRQRRLVGDGAPRCGLPQRCSGRLQPDMLPAHAGPAGAASPRRCLARPQPVSGGCHSPGCRAGREPASPAAAGLHRAPRRRGGPRPEQHAHRGHHQHRARAGVHW